MKKILLLLSIVGAKSLLFGQCDVTANATSMQITCGQSTTLSHAGTSQGNISFQENFNNGAATGWESTQQATYTNPCSPNGVDGTTHMWMGDNSGVPRQLTTFPLNFGPSVAPAGGTICFDLLFAEQGDASPCEGPDESDEGVYLQYSVDNGATWINIHYFDPNGGNDPDLVNWNNWCFPIPAAALINGVKFRWFQDADSGAAYDHWGIDNVEISVNDPSVQYTWVHDGYTTSQIGQNPTPVSPTTTTTYTVNMTTSNGNCSTSITIVVVPPTFVIDLGNDTTICPNACVTLNAEAYELVSPASTPTFSNQETAVVTGTPMFPIGVPCVSFSGCPCANGTTVGFGQSCPPAPGTITAEMVINVQGLNETTLSSGSITSICLTQFSITPGFGCTGTSLADVSIVLVSPGGTEVVLAPTGTMTGNTIADMCFNIGAPAYTTSTSPYTGTFSPANAWTSLTGSSVGAWSLDIRGLNAQTCIPVGSIGGWSITFDDPEITEPVNYTWSPTAGMTNSTTLSPTICPTATTTYTLTVADTDGCATDSDQITITIGSCCALQIDNIPTVSPSCTASDGQITIDYSGEITGLTFSIDGGTTFQNTNVFSNLPAGTYNVQIVDDANCPVNQVVVLTSSNAPTFTTTIVDPTCGTTNGSIAILASGGTNPLQYSNDNGATFQALNTFSNLGAATYQVIVKDANGCQSTASVQLVNPNAPVIDNIAIANTPCGITTGSITIQASGGVGQLDYTLGSGTAQTGNIFNNLGANSYQITVTDDNGCSVSQTAIVTENAGPTITSITPTAPNCGAADGVLVIVATGVANLSYSIDSGTTSQATGTFNNLGAETYQVVVADANGCEATQQVILNTSNLPNVNAGVDLNICAGDSVTLFATGAATYVWNNNVINGIPFAPSATAIYTVTGTDGAGCVNTDIVTVTVTAVPNANFTPDLISGNPPLTVVFTNTTTNANGYVWDFGNGSPEINTSSSGTQTSTFNQPGVYTVQLTASNGNCTDIFTFPITVLGYPPFEMHIPNVFTPNDDSANDVFFIDVKNGKTIAVTIFNRWGNKMFEMDDFADRWDGKDATEGVYFFKFEITDMMGEMHEGHGHVTLIRK